MSSLETDGKWLMFQALLRKLLTGHPDYISLFNMAISAGVVDR